jgi:hypothetical protein
MESELTLITVVALLGLGLAWVVDDSIFAAVFAIEAAFAGAERLYRKRSSAALCNTGP